MTSSRSIGIISVKIAYSLNIGIHSLNLMNKGFFVSIVVGGLIMGGLLLPIIAVSASSDFNNDGKDDLAIGAQYESVGTKSFAGAVNALYGTSAGISSSGDQLWSQDTSGIQGTAASSEGLGTSLVSGDFNGDGNSDLAIGVPGEAVNSFPGAGAVNVIYGSSSGLATLGNQLWTQDSPGVLDAAEINSGSDVYPHEFFGNALAAGDFNGDGKDDLAIGVPNESVGTILNAGAVNVLYGSSSGLTATGNQFWNQDSPGIAGTASSDHFGSALAAGDFDHDGFADLAIGVPGDDVGTKDNVGAVNIIRGSSSGLTSTNNQLWSQDSPGILDTAENQDNFGSDLATGDFDNDGFSDLAIGAYYETLNTDEPHQGAVNVLYGGSAGLSSTDNQFWTQDSPGIESGAEKNDFFGSSLASGDFDNDGYSDLAVGVPNEDVNGKVDIGAVNVIYGSSSGLNSAGDQFWTQDSSGILGTAEPYTLFGSALGTGDYNGDGRSDLAIGDMRHTASNIDNAGTVNIIYGISSDGLGATGNQIWTQNSPGVEDTVEEGDFFGSALS